MAITFSHATDDILDALTHELEVLQPDEETLLRCNYARIHSAVAAALARGNTMRQVLELLKQNDLDMHHATLSKLYRAESEARNERSERVCCVMCGQPMKPKETAHAEASIPKPDAIDASEEAAA